MAFTTQHSVLKQEAVLGTDRHGPASPEPPGGGGRGQTSRRKKQGERGALGARGAQRQKAEAAGVTGWCRGLDQEGGACTTAGAGCWLRGVDLVTSSGLCVCLILSTTKHQGKHTCELMPELSSERGGWVSVRPKRRATDSNSGRCQGPALTPGDTRQRCTRRRGTGSRQSRG